MKRNMIRHVFYSFIFTMSLIVFSKVKIHIIFGTPMNFSFVAMLGPIIASFVGTSISFFVLFSARFIQIVLGISKSRSIASYIAYLPAFVAGHYFSRLVRRLEKNNAELNKHIIFIPILAIIIFVLHPLGRIVWFYSLFWLIPISIYLLAPRLEDRLEKRPYLIVYLYALAATYIDHAVGAVIYGLFIFEVPVEAWIQSIPWVPIERAIFALGIALLYLFFRAVEKAFTTYVIVGTVNVEVVYDRDEYKGREDAGLVARKAL